MNHQYKFNKKIQRWDEGIPLGNGIIGTLVWAKTDQVRLALDRSDIWDTTPCEEIQREEFSYSTMVRYAKEKNIEKIREIFDGPYNHLIPSKLPVGALILNLSSGEEIKSVLDLQSASMKMECVDFKIQCFVHANKRVGFAKVVSEKSSYSWAVEHPAYNTEKGDNSGLTNSVDTAVLSQLHYPAAKTYEEEKFKYFVQKINENFSYGIFIKELSNKDGNVLIYTVGASSDGINWENKAINLLDRCSLEGFEKNFSEHKKWWEEFWNKSRIEIPDSFMEKNWYMANYLLASCSRKGGYPMPLQGLWTADDGKMPPWKGDYHHDLNTELSYYHYIKSNHLEEGECFLDYLWNLRACGKKFAKEFYHAKGACLPATMTIDGQPLGGWGMYSLSPTMSIWLSQMFERYYRYTGDEFFLENRAFPYMRDTGMFIESLLVEKDGMLYLPISSSPEIHDDDLESFLTPNSNFDLSLMRFLFERLSFYSEKLGTGEQEHWRSLLNRLPELAVNEKNVLMLSPDESLRESHRHLSHLMAIHPLRMLKYENPCDRKIIQASIADLERLGKGAWVGYSFGWAAQLYAISKNGNAAGNLLKTFWESFCSENGFHLNGDFKNRGITASHYRPFTLEANMCAADALQEMLLYSEEGTVELFPAIPDEWKEDKVAFYNFRGENGCLISAESQKGMITYLEIRFFRETKVFLKKNAYLQNLNEYSEETQDGYYLYKKAGDIYYYKVDI